MKDPEDAYKYAKDIIKGRWPEAEKYIMKVPEDAYKYAKDIIKGRFPEGEEAIKSDEYYAEQYRNFIG